MWHDRGCTMLPVGRRGGGTTASRAEDGEGVQQGRGEGVRGQGKLV
jgi:hypothetical protein